MSTYFNIWSTILLINNLLYVLVLLVAKHV